MFGKTQTLPSKPVEYPVGTFLKTPRGYFYISSPEKRYYLVSKRVLDSWNPHRVVETSEEAVKNYRIAAKMRFRNGSLIHNLADGKIYLIAEGRKHHMVSPDAFDKIGAKTKEAVTVSLDEINLHESGEVIR
jgi:hypothetical protein